MFSIAPQPKTENADLLKSGPPLFGDVEPHSHTTQHDQRNNYWGSGAASDVPGPSDAPDVGSFMGGQGPSYASCGEVGAESFGAALGCRSPTGSNISGQTHHTHTSNTPTNNVNESSMNFDSKAEGMYYGRVIGLP